MAQTPRILLVDDSADFLNLTRTYLNKVGDFSLVTETTAREGLEQIASGQIDCVVSDYEMPEMNGLEFLKTVREGNPDLPFVLFTGKGSESISSRAISAGVSDYLQKGAGTERFTLLANRISNLVAQYQATNAAETRARQQELVAELGQEALDGAPLESVFEYAVANVADGLDNELAKVLDYDPARNELLLRAGVGWRDGLAGEATVGDGADSQAGHTLRSEEPIIVDDLRTEDRFSGPPLLVEHDVVSGISVIIGTPENPWGVLGTHTTRHEEFSDDDINFVQSIANILATAISRTDYKQKPSL